MPVLILWLAAFPVSLCYYLFSKRAREESRRYLDKVRPVLVPGTKISPYLHILSFSFALIEKIEAWGGRVRLERIHFQDDDVVDLVARLKRREGALLLCSHLGNVELLRALATFNQTSVTIIVDFSVTAAFNRMLNELEPRAMVRLISVNDIGPETVSLLQERLTAGELVGIACDRTSLQTRHQCLSLNFLGTAAPFPYGPFFLAALLNVPVYALFAPRQKDIMLSAHYVMHVHKSPLSFDCSRKERNVRIIELARFFVAHLEYYCKQHPLQWYNFYDFWEQFQEEE
jgi:predicted LPLAT superfamily acyltransferase